MSEAELKRAFRILYPSLPMAHFRHALHCANDGQEWAKDVIAALADDFSAREEKMRKATRRTDFSHKGAL